MSDDTKTLDVWVAGTEEPELTPTDEGAQEISIDESGRRVGPEGLGEERPVGE